MAQLRFFAGPMGAGKSTLALQLEYNYLAAGRAGVVLSCFDRGGHSTITSRLGLTRDAIEVTPDLDLSELLTDRVDGGGFVIADEAQFYTRTQIDQLAVIVDERDIDVDCFGLLTDFRSHMFAGSQRLLELADTYSRLQLDVLCWCGRPGSQNARVVDGVVVHHGEQVLVGDTAAGAQVHYQVLCRPHWRRRELPSN